MFYLDYIRLKGPLKGQRMFNMKSIDENDNIRSLNLNKNSFQTLKCTFHYNLCVLILASVFLC